MITIRFSDPSLLPDRAIAADGPVSRAFLELGITDLHGAARHVRGMPYWRNADSEDVLSLLREGHGTCVSKHNIVAELARENDVPVFRIEGVYWLNDGIVPGVSQVLSRYALREIPRAHCFLECCGRFFDLTEGNCTGKRCMVTEYVRIGRVGIGHDNAVLKDFLEDWRRMDDTARRLGERELFRILDECAEHNFGLCDRAATQGPHGSRFD